MSNLPQIQQRSVEELIDRNLLEHKRDVEEILNRFHNTIIIRALHLSEGNISAAARLLQTHRNNLARWMKEYEIDCDGMPNAGEDSQI